MYFIYTLKHSLVILKLSVHYFIRFSPIENMFGFTKQKMKEFIFKKREELTMKVITLMFSYTEARIKSFFRKTLSNMVEFWTKLDR